MYPLPVMLMISSKVSLLHSPEIFTSYSNILHGKNQQVSNVRSREVMKLLSTFIGIDPGGIISRGG